MRFRMTELMGARTPPLASAILFTLSVLMLIVPQLV
jgi:hypothetical protein